MPEPRVAALILAAGRGTRFGAEPKVLAEFRGHPLVRHAAKAALDSRAGPVCLVIGAHGTAIRAALAGGDVGFVDNADYAEGLSTSLRAGLAALPSETDAAVILLGDMPRITSAHIDGLISAYGGANPRPAAVVPVNGGRRGNPVLLDLRKLAGALSALSGDRGAAPLLAGRDDVVEVEMDAGIAFDVDTPESLSALG
jgi:molybdenum cofactor cytidylyltransferase